ncbi:HAD family hydrolase [Bacillus thuringiensis]|uniref:D,D-heptose 1,7-bisphosphate phosphatase n=1 Tax=Bacillus cereus (strain VD146) TaxID=1053236 RepID=R8MD45_BACCX|nr:MULTISPECIES: HAD family hydrolase [Bacillus cereus group]EOP32325.1 histidinol-phosphate phosphatase domain-containing protein [Bacillus cereus VD146]MDZ3956268.1 HAD family hydrolase [Bacillus thuringiensis]RGP43403.1 D-glycero-beta-D-manno-heptose-1,7-bisphosphate 7-phosphatase [Bacillus thuringiensis]
MKNKAIFLDRDGVLNECMTDKVRFVNQPSDLFLLPGTAQAIKIFKEQDYKVYIVTNQGGIGLGYMTTDALNQIHEKLKKDLLKEEPFASIDEISTCIHSPKENCICRKPEPGLIINLANTNNIDLSNSYMVGDRETDIESGQRAGTKTILISNYQSETKADKVFPNLLDFAIHLQKMRLISN